MEVARKIRVLSRVCSFFLSVCILILCSEFSNSNTEDIEVTHRESQPPFRKGDINSVTFATEILIVL